MLSLLSSLLLPVVPRDHDIVTDTSSHVACRPGRQLGQRSSCFCDLCNWRPGLRAAMLPCLTSVWCHQTYLVPKLVLSMRAGAFRRRRDEACALGGAQRFERS